MTNCNDCIHEQTCDQSSRQLWSIMAGELECTDFKDRTNYVEVVRCKDCKHREDGVCCLESVYDYPWYYTNDDDFCSCGERREGE